ncbi:major capsid protein, partial [Escherichia coli]|nr:major capsid protein [Escherichia coli]
YGQMAYAPKMWEQPDPGQRFLMMQSAPMVIPSRVNACLCASVV